MIFTKWIYRIAKWSLANKAVAVVAVGTMTAAATPTIVTYSTTHPTISSFLSGEPVSKSKLPSAPDNAGSNGQIKSDQKAGNELASEGESTSSSLSSRDDGTTTSTDESTTTLAAPILGLRAPSSPAITAPSPAAQNTNAASKTSKTSKTGAAKKSAPNNANTPTPNSTTTVPTVPSVGGRKIYVSSSSSNSGNGSSASPFKTIALALDVAQPGDVVEVGAGQYGGFSTVRSGVSSKPIVINGQVGAKVVGSGTGRLIQIKHSFIVLQSLDISNGDTGIYVQSMSKPGVVGTRILHNTVHDVGGECIRMKYFATSNEIAYNTIRNCGKSGFNLSKGQRNGEGIYLGTAPEQLTKNPTQENDVTRNNIIHHNDIVARAECVDLKEYSTANTIEYNVCTGNEDPNSGAFSSRGDGNIFQYNYAHNLIGAGIRFGGDTQSQGVNNVARYNTLVNMGNYGIKAERSPQGAICGNSITSAAKGLIKSGFSDPRAAC